MTLKTILTAGALTALAMTACAVPGPTDPLAGQRLPPPPLDHDALLTHPDRPAADFTDDAARRPADVLKFSGVGYGMTVVEMEAGGGYYTELLAHAVGPDGKVFMQNPVQFDAFAGAAIKARLDNRLANTVAMRTPFDQLTVADGEVDLVTWFLGPHELWFVPAGAEAGLFGDPDKAFAEIARVLKPGGVFVAIDHVAAPGSPPETGNGTHRIDPDIVRTYAEAAGLELVETSDILANPDDDYEAYVLAPAVRRKTDRFVYKFRKAG